MGHRSRREERRAESPPPPPPERNVEWTRFVSTQERLEALVWDGVLQDQATAGWRPAAGENFPTPETREVVVFESAYLRGFGLPAHPFFHGLLYYYGLELCHLNPNSILHIAIFIHLCEAFLGIAPHFDHFRHFFWIKPQRSAKKPNVVGGAGVQLKHKYSSDYIPVPLVSSNKGWHSEWFYAASPCNIDARPVPRSFWDEEPRDPTGQVAELVGLIRDLCVRGLTGIAVMWSFVSRHIQPLKERAHPTHEYAGEDFDSTREVPERGSPRELAKRVR